MAGFRILSGPRRVTVRPERRSVRVRLSLGGFPRIHARMPVGPALMTVDLLLSASPFQQSVMPLEKVEDEMGRR
jgi:hypothetical protein